MKYLLAITGMLACTILVFVTLVVAYANGGSITINANGLGELALESILVAFILGSGIVVWADAIRRRIK